MKKLLWMLFVVLAFPCLALAQFSKNPVIYDDGTLIEGGGREIDFKTGISAEYNETTGRYDIDNTVAAGGVDLGADYSWTGQHDFTDVSITGEFTVNGQPVCLEDGTGCPATLGVDEAADYTWTGHHEFVTIETSSDVTVGGDLHVTGSIYAGTGADAIDPSGADSGDLLVSDGTTFSAVPLSGDCTIDATGDISCTAGTSTLAGATDSNISTPSAGQILIYDGTDTWDNKTVGGDCTIDSTGDLTCTASSTAWTVDGDNVYRATGNVGVGTSDPQHTLDVAGSGTGVLSLDDNLVLSAGNFGVGTTNPGYPLEVAGTVHFTGAFIDQDVTVNGQSVCLEDGTNCPVSGSVNESADYNWTGHHDFVSVELTGDLTVNGQNVCLEDGTDCPVSGSVDTAANYSWTGQHDFVNVSVSGAATVDKATDPNIVFSPDGNDTDFWIGVNDDNDNTDDDLFQIGDGVAIGTNPFVTIKTDGKVGIGLTAPVSNLDVSGPIAQDGYAILTTNGTDAKLGRENNGSGTRNASVGYRAGYSSTGNYGTNLGYLAGSGASNAYSYNNFFGYQSGYSNANEKVTALGAYSAYQNSGSSVVAGGYYAARENSGSSLVCIGDSSCYLNTAGNIATIGYYGGRESSGGYSNGIGYMNLYLNSGIYSNAIGYQSLRNNSGDNVFALGSYSGLNNTGDNCIFIGDYQGKNNSTANMLYIDIAETATPLISGNFATDKVLINGGLNSTGSIGIGTTAPSEKLEVVGNGKFSNVSMSGDLTVTGNDITMGTNTAGYIMVADGTNFSPVEMSGDCTIGATGVMACGAGTSTLAGATDTDITTPSVADFLAYDGDTWNNVPISGDCTADQTGEFTCTASSTAWTVDGANVYRDAGNVGIGTSDPQHTLDVSGAGAGKLVVADDVYVETGNFGVWTTTPDYPLEVAGTAHFAGVYVDADVTVNGQSVCLEDGTNCQTQTWEKDISIISVVDTDDALAQIAANGAWTITNVSCSTNTGTVTLQFDERAPTTPNSAGTDILSSPIACDADSETTSSFDNAGISDGNIISMDVDSVAGTPGVVRVHIKGTK